jgi:hypothetical protein
LQVVFCFESGAHEEKNTFQNTQKNNFVTLPLN